MAYIGTHNRREKERKGFIATSLWLLLISAVVTFIAAFLLGRGPYEYFRDVRIISMISFMTENPAFDKSRGILGIYAGGLTWLIMFCYSYLNYEKRKNSRSGEEYGSSRFLTKREFPEFKRLFFYDPAIVRKYKRAKTVYDPDQLKMVCKKVHPTKAMNRDCFLHSQVIGEDVYLSMNAKFLARNLNTITIGGSGSGKSYSVMFPNILMGSCNYVITDPSGETLSKLGSFLEKVRGYRIIIFNIDDFTHSMRYNPLLYVKTEKDINILVDELNRNIKPLKSNGGNNNEFFDDAKDALMCALIGLLKEIYPIEGEMDEEVRRKNRSRQTLKNVMRLLTMAEMQVKKDNGKNIAEKASTLNGIFEKLKRNNPRSYAAAMWDAFKVGDPKICNEVIISASAVFSRYFNTTELEWLTGDDELNLYDLAKDAPCALFVVTPSTDTTYNFMVRLLYTQLFSIVTAAGKENAQKRGISDPALPRHLSFWLDEFANIGKLPQFMELLSVVRKYNISINIIIQALSQLKGMYKDSWETILGNVDTTIYLGGQEPSTTKALSEKIGKETIKVHTYNLSKRSGDSEGYQNAGRFVLDPSEIEKIPRAYEMVFVTGCRPIMTRKYNLKNHPNYRYTSECSRKYAYDLYYLTSRNRIDIKELEAATISEMEIRAFTF